MELSTLETLWGEYERFEAKMAVDMQAARKALSPWRIIYMTSCNVSRDRKRLLDHIAVCRIALPHPLSGTSKERNQVCDCPLCISNLPYPNFL